MKLKGEETRYRLVGGPFDGGSCKGETRFVIMPVPRESGNVQKFAIYEARAEHIAVIDTEKVTHFAYLKMCSERDIDAVMEELDPESKEEENA